jgi:hypothetical protein
MSEDMNLEQALQLPNAAPLADAVGSIDQARFVGKSLYRIADGIYLYLSKVKNKNLETDSSAPYVIGVFAIPDDDAAKRVLEQAIDKDSGAVLLAPPMLLPAGASPKYGEIIAGLKSANPKVCMEAAQYSYADGRFASRTIETEGYKYFFRGEKDDANEAPYAILHKLNKT